MEKFILLLLLAIVNFAYGQGISNTIELMHVGDEKLTPIKACAECKGVVIIFTSHGCAYDQHYRDRIKKLSDKHSASISFFLINANPGEEEDEGKMKEAFLAWGMPIPYLSDKKQLAMTMLNAKRTPEAFLLKPEGNTLKTIYQGAIDDNPQVHYDTGKKFLDEAITEFLSGKPLRVATERAVGCTIRKGS